MLASSLRWAAIGLAVALTPALIVGAPQAAGEKAKWSPRRTVDGQPDIQGQWSMYDSTPLEVAGPDDDKDLAVLRLVYPGLGTSTGITGPNPAEDFNETAPGQIKNSRRTSLVIDPPDRRVPIRREAMQKRDEHIRGYADDYLHLQPMDRCITRGVPAGFIPIYSPGHYIMQAPGLVVIHSEMIHEPRVIYLNRPHLPPNVRFWNGDSRGHWEGNTLVVDVTNFNGKSAYGMTAGTGRLKGIEQSEDSHVVERFTIVDEKTINYQATIEDPQAFTKPWTFALPMNRDQAYVMYEYACHEGNYTLPNILRGDRFADRTRSEKR